MSTPLLRISSSLNPLFCQEARGASCKQDSGIPGSEGFPGMIPLDQALPHREWVGDTSGAVLLILLWKAGPGS